MREREKEIEEENVELSVSVEKKLNPREQSIEMDREDTATGQ